MPNDNVRAVLYSLEIGDKHEERPACLTSFVLRWRERVEGLFDKKMAILVPELQTGVPGCLLPE